MTTLSLRSEECRQRVSALESLSTSIIHDLRNPLGTVCAAAEMLMELDPEPIQVRRLAANIFRAAGRMREAVGRSQQRRPGRTNQGLRYVTSSRSSLRHRMQHRAVAKKPQRSYPA